MLRSLLIDEILEEFNRGVPSAVRYIAKAGSLSRYNQLKVDILVVFQNLNEKTVRANLWQYKFLFNDLDRLTDSELYSVYVRFASRKNMCM
jgi:hypothetical protein